MCPSSKDSLDRNGRVLELDVCVQQREPSIQRWDLSDIHSLIAVFNDGDGNSYYE